MTTSILKRDISRQRLKETYRDLDYYWYHRSAPFVKTFLKPLASIINEIGLPCLDIGCGEGQLSPFIDVPYHGFDASEDAIKTARHSYEKSTKTFAVTRLEEFKNDGHWGTLVFGNVLHCLVREEEQLNLVESRYVNDRTRWIVLYELERFNTCEFDQRYELMQEVHARVEMKGIVEVKKNRKILVYRC